MRRSVRSWIRERRDADRIAALPHVRAARELDTSARLAQESEQIAAALATPGLVKRLPTRVATAPSIRKIRAALAAGDAIEFRRGKTRTIVFNPGPEDLKRPVHDEGGLPGRRRRRRSPPRNQTPR